jgi:MORN repeat variant
MKHLPLNLSVALLLWLMASCGLPAGVTLISCDALPVPGGLCEANPSDSSGFVVWYEGGVKIGEGNLTAGQLQGFWKFYYADGKLKEEGGFEACERSGFYKFYHESGQVKAEGHYQKGVPQGDWQYYDAEGKLLLRQAAGCK